MKWKPLQLLKTGQCTNRWWNGSSQLIVVQMPKNQNFRDWQKSKKMKNQTYNWAIGATLNVPGIVPVKLLLLRYLQYILSLKKEPLSDFFSYSINITNWKHTKSDPQQITKWWWNSIGQLIVVESPTKFD